MTISIVKTTIVFALAVHLAGCITVTVAPQDCPADSQKLAGCPPIDAIADSKISELYAERSWIERADLDADIVNLGANAKIPVNNALAKFFGSTDAGGLDSLATKIWMIEQADHTIDVIYYIFRADLVGYAVLGALCDAVQRGVDVRIMIDSLGSLSFDKRNLKALESCEINGGFIRNADGEVTVHKARVQPVIFNSASQSLSSINRRSHDKMLLIDGRFPNKSMVMTGGRNISLDYYGILSDGSKNPHTYRDSEILLRASATGAQEQYSVGDVSEIYYSLLFQFKNNKRLSMTRLNHPIQAYKMERQLFSDSLEALKALPEIKDRLDNMSEYMETGFHPAEIRLAHELSNLTNKKVVSNAVENLSLNPNSIVAILNRLQNEHVEQMRIVSPYIFAARYYDDEGNVIVDDAQFVHEWLEANPNSTVELITNSVLTSDNFFTQAVIDMDLVPRLLLSEELQAKWLAKTGEDELDPELVESKEWLEMVNHPRLTVYETGQINDTIFGGNYDHSKLHAKYIIGDQIGFIGTSNFDYRSRLYNNEMGFFFRSQKIADDANANTDYLISLSYRWGSPEWLEMRHRLMALEGRKASKTRKQRKIFKRLRKTGLEWLF
jgi:putative cardiolipin synthase